MPPRAAVDRRRSQCARLTRLGSIAPSRFDRSIQQFDAALEKQPKLASSLYGRGIDKLRMGNKASGEADMAAASAIQPNIADQMRTYDIAP